MRSHLALAVALADALPGCIDPKAKDPSTVIDVRVDQVADGARLTWDESPRGVAVKYLVYKNGKKVADVKAASRTFIDSNVTAGVTYSYAISAVTSEGREGAKTEPVEFRLRRSLTLDQEAGVNRGFVNLTVAEVTPGLRWGDLLLTVGGASVARDDGAYVSGRAAWTHSAPRDGLVDLDEDLRLHAPGRVVRNASVEVKHSNGTVLWKGLLEGRPTLNMTLRQERNVTDGQTSLNVLSYTWRDAGRDVTKAHPSLAPRWAAVEITVNGTYLQQYPDARSPGWSRDNPTDQVVRAGHRMDLRSPLLVPGAVVVVRDAEAGEESFRLVLK